MRHKKIGKTIEIDISQLSRSQLIALLADQALTTMPKLVNRPKRSRKAEPKPRPIRLLDIQRGNAMIAYLKAKGYCIAPLNQLAAIIDMPKGSLRPVIDYFKRDGKNLGVEVQGGGPNRSRLYLYLCAEQAYQESQHTTPTKSAVSE